MKDFPNTICYLPDEILFFKTITSRQDDPIRKYMFNLKELNYIMKRISRFSVCSKSFFSIYSLNDKEKLLNFLCRSYLNDDIRSVKDYYDVKKFLYIFFDYINPIYHETSYDKLWIYPRLDIKNFINNSMFESKKEEIYFDVIALNKLVSVFTSFTKYEYSNCDENIAYIFEGLNYPSLILANIDLYEKGYIEVVENLNEIKILLNKKNKAKGNIVFTENRSLLKNYILNFINSNEDAQYSLADFL